MKKKQGFTLAEVLITLSIIGVVSALTAPSLMSSFQKSKVGPSLKKFMNTIETANQHILTDEGSDTLSGAIGEGGYSYTHILGKYVKGQYVGEGITDIDANAKTPTYYNGTNAPTPTWVFQFNDGSSMAKASGLNVPTGTVPANSSYKGVYDSTPYYYDINGFQNEPNRLGKDIFVFIIDDSGTVVPYGSRIANKIYGIDYWNTPSGCPPTPSSVSNGSACAGSVIDNDGKVVYKY